MTIELTLIISFIFHLLGDYIFQNHWMAVNKTKEDFPALVHATIYSLPFLFLVHWQCWFIILITHFYIDRYRLATYWIKLVNWNWKSTNNGYDDNVPVWLSTWLMIIIDNIIHIIINTLVILFSIYFYTH